MDQGLYRLWDILPESVFRLALADMSQSDLHETALCRLPRHTALLSLRGGAISFSAFRVWQHPGRSLNLYSRQPNLSSSFHGNTSPCMSLCQNTQAALLALWSLPY